MNHPLLFQWGVSTLYGWGVIGLNMLRHWRPVAGTPVYCGGQIHIESLGGMGPLALRALTPVLVENSDLRERWPSIMAENGRFDGLVLHSLGNQFTGTTMPREGGLTGRATCAALFFEDTNLSDAAQTCHQYAAVITGSTWCEEVLRAAGVTNAVTVIQGVDPAVFHPAPRSGFLDGRFVVFSGGKLEHRKAQDLVLLAFRAFAQRHPEAVLVTAWHSPWPAVSVTVNRNPGIAPVTFDGEGKSNTTAWAAANGLREDQFIDVGSIPNHLMAPVLREADVALFPNRCEGGTNLVAMECMASGVPTIVSDNTGHKDLVATGAPYTLIRQGPVHSTDMGTDGWGESDLDEIVETLERVWSDRGEARERGAAGANAMSKWTWHSYVQNLHDAVAPLCP